MRNTQSRGILLGAGVLGAMVIGGLSGTASAQTRGDVKEAKRDVKAARQDLRKDRRDVRQANTPAERRDQREDVRDARQNVRTQSQQLAWERQQRNNYYSRYGNYNNYRRGTTYAAGNRYNNAYNNSRRTLEGVVSNDNNGNAFTIRTNNGQSVRVQMTGGRKDRVDRGDVVRVYGSYNNGVLTASSVNILRNR